MFKIYKKIGLIINIFFLMLICNTNLAYAVEGTPTALSQKHINLDELMPRLNGESPEKDPELDAVGNLPEITTEAALTSVVKTILAASMLLTIIAIVIVGYYYLTSQGEDDNITKAKSIILYLVIGVAIMAAAYGIVSGISQFDFFK